MLASQKSRVPISGGYGGLIAPGEMGVNAFPSPVPEPSMRICLVINPSNAYCMAELRTEVVRLRARGDEVVPRLTFEKGDGTAFAREAAEAGFDLVIAAGGDGTVNEVASGLHGYAEAQNGRGKMPRLGIIPLGTGNDFSAAQGVPDDTAAAIAVAISGKPLALDVATINGKCFVNVSTGGAGAEATEETPDEAKRILGAVAYFITGVKKLVRLEPSHARFAAAEEIYDGPFLIFAVGNSGRTGGGNWIAPRADPGDGLLDLCIVKEVPRRELLKLLPEIRAGEHLDHPAVIYRRVRELQVESAEELSVNADGEPISGKVFRYAISPYQIMATLG